MKLGDRMKEWFESTTKQYLPRKVYTLLRIDGKAFHTYTKSMDKPFDLGMVSDMCYTTRALCSEIPGAVLGYTQSDEISILIYDFAKPETQPWFSGNVQKITSVSASIATAEFNKSKIQRLWHSGSSCDLEEITRMANFDARVFTFPSKDYVEDYFVWRQMDCIRNSISMAARNVFSHKQLDNVNTTEMKAMMLAQGVDWEAYADNLKYGSVVFKREEEKDLTFTKKNGEVVTMQGVKRKLWVTEPAPVFTEDRDFLQEVVPTRS